jgi:hypothetical protein
MASARRLPRTMSSVEGRVVLSEIVIPSVRAELTQGIDNALQEERVPLALSRQRDRPLPVLGFSLSARVTTASTARPVVATRWHTAVALCQQR